jgi:hypothetical protein
VEQKQFAHFYFHPHAEIAKQYHLCALKAMKGVYCHIARSTNSSLVSDAFLFTVFVDAAEAIQFCCERGQFARMRHGESGRTGAVLRWRCQFSSRGPKSNTMHHLPLCAVCSLSCQSLGILSVCQSSRYINVQHAPPRQAKAKRAVN